MDVSISKQILDATSLQKRAAEPGFVLLRTGGAWRAYDQPKEVIATEDPAAIVDSLRQMEDLVRTGREVAGFLSYEAGYALEPQLAPVKSKSSGTLLWFGIFERAEVLEDIHFPESETEEPIEKIAPTITSNRYFEKLDEIRELIAAGEVYQINFTYPVKFNLGRSPWQLFIDLCRRHPVPYAAFINTGEQQIVSLSPELFFRIGNGKIRVKPMKGTAPRGLTLEEDELRGQELSSSEKNRAENVMIVDLMRNDLSRICRTGTVETTRLFDVERFPSIWQMTSTIQGDLTEGCTIEEIFRALFPSGSVTGAPKIRAMQHIARLETFDRGVYTGAIGYFAREEAHFSVPIRTIVMQEGSGVMGVGSGITHDSVPAEESEECQWKSAFLTTHVPEFQLLETLLWDGEYHLLSEHLGRMKASALYFGFSFSECDISSALLDYAGRLGVGAKRVRLTSMRDGRVRIEHSDAPSKRFGRVRISMHRVSSQDRFVYHKTTNRELYDRELKAAITAGFDDSLFFNERGELTEGSIHNVFLVKDDIWKTPPVRCGLLPGTFREKFLRDNSGAIEEMLTMDDLISADRIYVCNSVRGMQLVTLETSNRRILKME
jgi:para-aminobenzoate synthetase/4-amino-4-deoxychorismate lyase